MFDQREPVIFRSKQGNGLNGERLCWNVKVLNIFKFFNCKYSIKNNIKSCEQVGNACLRFVKEMAELQVCIHMY